jgi:hypothetical protein
VLSGALSRALCLVNKTRLCSGGRGSAMKRRARPRVLCLQGSADAPEQYIAIMNVIFAAQVRHGGDAGLGTGGTLLHQPHAGIGTPATA